MRPYAFLAVALGLAWAVPSRAAEAEPGPAPRALGWLEVLPSVPSAALPAARVTQEEFQARGLLLLGQTGVYAALREHDRRQGFETAAGSLLAEGRQLHLGLKLEEAARRYREAADLLARGFFRFYDPDRLAEPLLQLGVAEFQAGRKEEAERAFLEVVALSPGLELAEGYYGPSVRAAFLAARARRGQVEPGLPSAEDLARMCRAAGLVGLVAVDTERIGDRPVARLALFDAAQRRLTAFESVVIQEGQWRSAGHQLAARLWPRVAALAGLPTGEPAEAAGSPDGGVPWDGGADGQEAAVDAGPPAEAGPPDGGLELELPDGGIPAPLDAEPVEPWYVEHWWIWPAAAVVLGVVIAVPLVVTREEVVDVRLHLR